MCIVKLYIYMVQRRPAPPMGMGVQSCFFMVPPSCGLWWWGVWDVGDGWPVLLLMVPPLPPVPVVVLGVRDVGDGWPVLVRMVSCLYVVYVGM